MPTKSKARLPKDKNEKAQTYKTEEIKERKEIYLSTFRFHSFSFISNS